MIEFKKFWFIRRFRMVSFKFIYRFNDEFFLVFMMGDFIDIFVYI